MTTPVLSAQAQRFVAVVNAVGAGKPPWTRQAAELRAEARAIAAALRGDAEPVAKIEQVDAGGIPARLYWPRGGERDALVWFHGGGWMVGELDDYDELACGLANRAGCAVLSVDYRLAPEDPYPSAVADCWAATAWARERFTRIAVGGDSAGGNLAAVVARVARDRSLPVVLQLLVYPVLDPDLNSPFVDEFIARYAGFAGQASFGEDSRRGVRHVWEVYVPDPKQRVEPNAAPARAGSLVGVAPASIILAEHDILRGEGQAYARRLRSSGVPAEVRIYAGQVHGFYHLLTAMPDAADAADHSARALRHAFERSAVFG